MNSKALSHALVGAVAFFVLGYLMYELLLADFLSRYMAGTGTMVMWAIAVSQLALGFLLASFMSGDGVTTGMKSAARIGLIYSAAVMFDLYGTTDAVLSFTGVLVMIIVETVRFALAGAVLGWWMGRGAASSDSGMG